MIKQLLSILCSTAFLLPCNAQIYAPKAIGPLPQVKQIAWQKRETIAFVHFGLNTFNNKEWGYGDADLKTFNPSALNCEQWAQTFVKAGIKEVIITCKHHDGFCLWPTHLTEYCIRNTPYKNGKGDIVGELAAACKKYGLKFGVYLSPWDRHQANYGTPEYIEYFYKELHELLTNYGEISEVWFDGANGGDGWYGGTKEVRKIDRKTYYNFPRAYKLVEQLQPNAVIFSDGGPGCRWIGNEDGIAGATNWSFLRSKEVYPGYDKYYELTSGHIDGDKWVPGECDVSIRPGWFYHPEEDNRVKTIDQLEELYYKSVGHNAQFLLNFPVDRRGLIFKTDSANAINYHKQILKELNTNLLSGINPIATNSRGGKFNAKAVTDKSYDTYWATNDGVTKATITFNLPHRSKVNRMLLQEYIMLGQRVSSFIIEYFDGKSWLPVNPHEETTTIGYKRIVRFDTVKTSKLRVRFLNARGCLCINNIEAFYSGNDNAFASKTQTNEATTLPFSLLNVNQEEAQKITDKDETTVGFIQNDEVCIDLGTSKQIQMLSLLPDHSEKRSGLISNYELYAIDGTDSANMSHRKLIAQGEFSNIKNNPIWQFVYFTPITTRFLVLKAVRMIDDAKKIGIADMHIQ
jgi:alpha-L-fucosidase